METKKIAIIGNGQIGQAIAYLLRHSINNGELYVYDKDETKNESHKPLKECVSDAKYIFLCLPSWFLKETLNEIDGHARKDAVLISVSKGLNANTGESIDEVIENNRKHRKYALLSGPMFAKEIIKDKMCFGVLATKNKSDFEDVSTLFEGTKLKMEYSKNIHSVALSGVLKNIYTLALSIIDCSLEDNNVKGYFAARAINEMQEVAKILGVDKNILLGTAGLADFIATVSSEHSQNRKVGAEIATKGVTSQKSEGLVSISPLINMIGKKHKKLPILCLLEKIIVENKDSQTEIANFFREI